MLGLIVAVVPLGVAGQNITATLVGGLLLALLAVYRKKLPHWSEPPSLKYPIKLALGLVGILTLAGAINPENPKGLSASLLPGYLFWMLFPSAAGLWFSPLRPATWQKLERLAGIMLAILGTLCASQMLWGWKIQGAQLVDASHRAQGLYSHPLTLAYVVMLFAPLAISRLLSKPRHWPAWAMTIGSLLGVYTSQSRMVQALVVLLGLWQIATIAKGKVRLLAAILAITTASLVALTDNPVQKRISGTIAGGYDRFSDYPDDRLAFWHAHWEMFKERPLLGHGEHLGKAYRAPYYERLGLGKFLRQYEAHNMFIQMSVNGGIIALMVFALWLLWAFGNCLHLAALSPFWGKIGLQTLALFVIGGLSQNAFQDAEVRYVLTLAVTATLLASKTLTATNLAWERMNSLQT